MSNDMTRPVTGRFAPSPTGRMHLGNIYAALMAWLSARSQGGRFILRIEDIDPQRSRAEYARFIEDDLHWLGIDWDERHVQSERYDIYEQHLKRLQEMSLTYPCYCTRADILSTQAPHESDGRVVYRGTCRPEGIGTVSLSSSSSSVHPSFSCGRKPSTRIFVPDRDISFTDGTYGRQTINLARHCGDFVLRRADGAWAYQLAVVVDDALMGVTEVVRGRDLLLSVPQQMYLLSLLGYPSPAFRHIPLLCNTSGQRLSKRDKSMDMAVLRQRFTPEELLGVLSHIIGITGDAAPLSANELLMRFSWDALELKEDKYLSISDL